MHVILKKLYMDLNCVAIQYTVTACQTFLLEQKQISSLMKDVEEAKQAIVKLKNDKKDFMVYSFHVYTLLLHCLQRMVHTLNHSIALRMIRRGVQLGGAEQLTNVSHDV